MDPRITRYERLRSKVIMLEVKKPDPGRKYCAGDGVRVSGLLLIVELDCSDDDDDDER